MPPPEPRVPLDSMRRAATLAVETSSLRAVARAVGMSPMGLRAFLEGRAPYSATLRKLTGWYLRHAAERPFFSADEARAALVVFLEAVPPDERPEAAGELLEALAGMHRRRRLTPPEWLSGLCGCE